jgi:hypothetical protein
VLTPCAKDEVNGMFFVETPQVRFDHDYRTTGDALVRGRPRASRLIASTSSMPMMTALSHGSREASEARIWFPLLTRGLARARCTGANGTDGDRCRRQRMEPRARGCSSSRIRIFPLAGRYTLLEQAPLDAPFPRMRAPRVSESSPAVVTGHLAGGTTWNHSAAPAVASPRTPPMPSAARRAAPAVQYAARPAHPLVSVIPGGQTEAETKQNAALVNALIPKALWQRLRTSNRCTRTLRHLFSARHLQARRGWDRGGTMNKAGSRRPSRSWRCRRPVHAAGPAANPTVVSTVFLGPLVGEGAQLHPDNLTPHRRVLRH